MGPLRRGPLQGLQDVADALSDEHNMSTFIRGLTVGALVGAALAGSRVWQRRHRKRRPPTSKPEGPTE